MSRWTASLVLVSVTGMVCVGTVVASETGRIVTGPEVLLDLPWGTEGTALGRLDADESAPMGPMSFAVGPGGELFVLDQVNYRVLGFTPEGEHVQLTLGEPTYQDLALAHGGELLVVDRLVQSSIAVMDRAGVEVGEYEFVGEGIPEGGGVTATFVRDDGVWLEFAHTYLVRVLDEELQPCPEEVVPGRLLPDGARVVAALDGLGGVDLRIEGEHGVLAEQTIDLEDRIDRIVWIEGDEQGHVVVLLHMWPAHPPPGQVGDYVAGIVFDPDLQVLDTFRSPYVITTHLQFREFAITPDGRVVQMAFTPSGVRFLQWRLR